MSALLTVPVACVECRAQRADANGLPCDYHHRRLVALLRVQVEQEVRDAMRPKPGQPCTLCGQRAIRPDAREVVATTLAEHGLDVVWLSEQEGRLVAALCPPGHARALGALLARAWGIETSTRVEQHLVRITALRANRWRLRPRGWQITVAGPGLYRLDRCAPRGVPLLAGAPPRGDRRVDPGDVVRLYVQEGWGVDDVASRAGICPATVRHILDAAGVAMRAACKPRGTGHAERLRAVWAEGNLTLSALVQRERISRRQLAIWLGVDPETTP